MAKLHHPVMASRYPRNSFTNAGSLVAGVESCGQIELLVRRWIMASGILSLTHQISPLSARKTFIS
jgi:hypothetical protein